MNENNLGYNELKKSLKEKYTNDFLAMLNDYKTEHANQLREILGDEYITLRDNLVDIENQIRLKRHDFLNSEEYVTAKTEMTNAKLKFDLSKEVDKEESEKALQNAVSNVSMLNTKLNNQLKDLYQAETLAKTKLKNLFDSKKEEIFEIKKQTEAKTQKEIAKILFNFFSELKDLNENFNVSENKQELPFSEDLIKSHSIYTDFEKSYFNGELPELNAQTNHDIIIENNTILN